MTGQTAKKYYDQALIENGMTNGVMSFDPPTAGKVIQRYKELMKMDADKIRNRLISKFIDLGVGDMPEVQTMQLDNLEAMIDQLQQAQDGGELDLETDQGINNLQRIVDPYLESMDQ